MEQEHRTKILNNIDKLIRFTNYDVLARACLSQNLLSQLTIDKIQLASTEEARHKKLIQKITHCGPNAYELFGDILREHFPDAYEILTHVSYRTMDTNDNEPIIRQPLNSQLGNAIAINATNSVTNNNNNNNNNNDIQNAEGPSTSRMLSTVRSLTSQFDQRAFMATIRNRPLPGKTHVVEYRKPVKSDLNMPVATSNQFHGDQTSKVGIYPMQSNKRGILILVNNIHFRNKPGRRRNGAETDRDNMVHVFRQMGFFVCVQEDLTKLEFMDLMKNTAQCRDIRLYDCFIFAVLSHGEQNEVEFVDGGKIDVEDILTRFNNHHCHYLVGKPKIFLFPFCRGPLIDHGVTRQMTENDGNGEIAEASHVPACIPYMFDMKICYSPGCDSPDESPWIREPVVQHNGTESDSLVTNHPIISASTGANIATFYDMKICYSTVSGYNSFRDPIEGSWYIQILCQVFAEHAHDTHLEDLLKIIGGHMNNKRTEGDHLQTVSNEDRGFNKQLYFNPGFYG